MIKHKFSTLIFISLLALYTGNASAAGKYNEPCDEISASSNIAVTQTQYGKVGGYLENNVFTFKGIPYAKAERFMPPTAPDQWKGIRSSRAYGPTCPQAERMGWQSDEQAFAFNWDDGFPGEDCLRVNIWTQGLKDEKKRPVMVWLHGGGYAAGSGQELPSYDGAALSRKGDVVVVTLNHRLNVLGFLDLSAYGGKYAQSVNVGLLDLVAALRWVNENIENFGGDPSNVTIFGQSGGGGKVSTLLATPSAKGLFQKAIVQSGSMQRTMESKYSQRIAAATLEELGIKAEEIDKLQTIPYKTLLAAGEKAIANVRKEAEKEGIHSFIFGWGPTVDGNILPQQPEKQAELSKDIPMMIGTTLHEFCISTYVPELRNATLDQAKEMLKLGCKGVLIKGGHLDGGLMCDVLQTATEEAPHLFTAPKVNSRNTHGTGCTLSSAIATFLALGEPMSVAVKKAKQYVYKGIESGKDVCIGGGHGPLNHFHSPVAMHIFDKNE